MAPKRQHVPVHRQYSAACAVVTAGASVSRRHLGQVGLSQGSAGRCGERSSHDQDRKECVLFRRERDQAAQGAAIVAVRFNDRRAFQLFDDPLGGDV